MPGFDGTGPWGRRPMTGGGRGFCAIPPRISDSEIALLKADLLSMREQLAQIEARIEKLRIEENKLNERNGK